MCDRYHVLITRTRFGDFSCETRQYGFMVAACSEREARRKAEEWMLARGWRPMSAALTVKITKAWLPGLKSLFDKPSWRHRHAR